MGAYCSKWEKGDVINWCYITDSDDASSCPGAQKSAEGDLYFSSHADVCTGNKIRAIKFENNKHNFMD